MYWRSHFLEVQYEQTTVFKLRHVVIVGRIQYCWENQEIM